MKKIINLKIDEVTNDLTIMRNGFNLGYFEVINGTYHYMDNDNGLFECYAERFIDIDTKATTLEDAIYFMKTA
jgi:hypothetical protein